MLDRLATALAGKTMLPIILAQVQPMLASADWRHRRAALLALSLTAEGCQRAIGSMLRSLVSSIVPFVADAHPRVRHAAMRCIGMLSMYFNESFDNEGNAALGEADAGSGHVHAGSGLQARAAKGAKERVKSIQRAAGDLVLQALVPALGAVNNDAPRLRGLAAAALTNFLMPDSCPAKVVKPFAAALMAGLYSVVQEVQLASVRILCELPTEFARGLLLRPALALVIAIFCCCGCLCSRRRLQACFLLTSQIAVPLCCRDSYRLRSHGPAQRLRAVLRRPRARIKERDWRRDDS